MKKLTYKLWGLAVATTFGLSLTASAQNLLINGTFTADFSGESMAQWTDPINSDNWVQYYLFTDKPNAVTGWIYTLGPALINANN